MRVGIQPRKLFTYHCWESVRSCIHGLGRLNFKHLVLSLCGIKLPTLRSFFRIIELAYYVLCCCQYMVSNVVKFYFPACM